MVQGMMGRRGRGRGERGLVLLTLVLECLLCTRGGKIPIGARFAGWLLRICLPLLLLPKGTVFGSAATEPVSVPGGGTGLDGGDVRVSNGQTVRYGTIDDASERSQEGGSRTSRSMMVRTGGGGVVQTGIKCMPPSAIDSGGCVVTTAADVAAILRWTDFGVAVVEWRRI